jgi:hypothetical protein
MTLPLKCRCGAVRGEMQPARAYVRATCYCKDCRAYARFLGQPDVLDDAGGTDVVPTAPATVRLTSGVERVACMSLSPKGTLRWYAGCCRTPLGNTSRNTRLPYLGLVTAFLDATPQQLDAAFGPDGRCVLNTGSATSPVRATPLAFARGGVRIMAGMLNARVRGERASPFLEGEARLLREPAVISREQRAALERLDG